MRHLFFFGSVMMNDFSTRHNTESWRDNDYIFQLNYDSSKTDPAKLCVFMDAASDWLQAGVLLYDHNHAVWQQLKPQLQEQGEGMRQTHPSQRRREAVWTGTCLFHCSENSGGSSEITMRGRSCCQVFNDALICSRHVCRGLFIYFSADELTTLPANHVPSVF